MKQQRKNYDGFSEDGLPDKQPVTIEKIQKSKLGIFYVYCFKKIKCGVTILAELCYLYQTYYSLLKKNKATSKMIPDQYTINFSLCRWYTCLTILLATFNYRARGTCGPRTLNYSLNGAANAREMEFSSPPSLKDHRAFSLLHQEQPSDFGIMLPLVPVVKILKKFGVTGKIWEKAGVKLLRDLTEKSVNFSILATSNIRLLLVFGEEDQ